MLLAAPRALLALDRVAPAAAFLAAAAGAAAHPSPTGWRGLDVVATALIAGVVVWLAVAAPPALVALAGGLALVGDPSRGAVLVAIAVGVALAAAFGPHEPRVLTGLAAVPVVVGALSLRRPSATGATALLALICLALPAAPALLRLPWRSQRWFLRSLAGTAAAIALGSAAGAVAAATARSPLATGAAKARSALTEAGRGDIGGADRDFLDAGANFHAARRRVDAWWSRPARAVPIVAQQLRAAGALASAGQDLSRTAVRAIAIADAKDLRIQAGRISLEKIEALDRSTAGAVNALARARHQLAAAKSVWVVPQVERKRRALSDRLARAEASLTDARRAIAIAPPLLGRDGPRRYFLALQTPSESRGTGGFIGSFGQVGANGGAVTLDRIGRTADLDTGGSPEQRKLEAPPDYVARYGRFDPQLLWQNVTMSPDFPTVASVIEGLYPQSGGAPIDGVIALDPYGLAALLSVVGPVSVPPWPEPITAANAAHVLLFDQYVVLDGQARVDFLGNVARAVWQRVLSTPATVADLARAMSPAIRGKHIQLASSRDDEERQFVALGVSGTIGRSSGDSIGVVTQNASGNKIDWFLHRTVEVDDTVDPSSGATRTHVHIVLRNDAPAAGLPAYVIGNALTPPLPNGTSKLYLSVYSPLQLEAARLDGRPTDMESEVELGRHVFSRFLTVGPNGTATVDLDLAGREAPGAGRALRLLRQAVVSADDYRVTIRWGRVRKTADLSLDRDVTISW